MFIICYIPKICQIKTTKTKQGRVLVQHVRENVFLQPGGLFNSSDVLVL